MAIFEFTVYRDSWYRGEGSCESFLSNTYVDKEGNKCRKGCCLGHAANDLGLGLDEIDSIGDLSEIMIEKTDHQNDRRYNDKFAALIKAENQAIQTNDNLFISDDEREKELKAIFAKEDIVINFKDGKRKWQEETTFTILDIFN